MKSVAGSFCKTRGSDFIRVVELMSISMGDVINTLGGGSEVNVVFEGARDRDCGDALLCVLVVDVVGIYCGGRAWFPSRVDRKIMFMVAWVDISNEV